jgi:hypothetical protein
MILFSFKMNVQLAFRKTLNDASMYVRQGCSQGVTGVTVVTGPSGALEGPRRVPRVPRKGPRKEAAREKAVKAKVDAFCFLEKGRK